MWLHSIDVKEKRETAKWLLLIQHRKLGKCVILVKEKESWKYGLLWGWIEKKYGKKEKKEDALRRELGEEIWQDYHIERIKDLVKIETRSQIHNVFALKIGWKFHPSPNEISWFAFYPLEDGYEKERNAIIENMETYAKLAVEDVFRQQRDRKSYEASNPQIDWKYFDQFHRELDGLMQQVLNKNKN